MDYNQEEAILRVLNEKSYYPKRERKSFEERKKDLIEWYEKYGEINQYYNYYGMDLADSVSPDKYLDSGVFRKERYEDNSKFFWEGESFSTNYTAIMRDKEQFEAFAAQTLRDESKYIKSYGIIRDGAFQSREGEYEVCKNDSPEAFVKRHEGEKLVLKRTTGSCGKSVYIIEIAGGKISYNNQIVEVEDFLKGLTKPANTWLIQPYLKQHSFLGELNPDVVNHVRVVTFSTGAKVVSVPAVLVYGRKGAKVSNAYQGGYFCSIDEGGYVDKMAFDKGEGERIFCPVGGRKLPFYSEIVEMACYLHSAIPQLFTVGWDITLTENGPCVIEGNDGWDPYLVQNSEEHVLRETYNRLLQERREYYGK